MINILSKEYLNYFTPDVLDAGRSLISTVRFNNKKLLHKLLAFVSDGRIYVVEINISYSSFDTFCYCKQKRGCKHGAAAVLKLLFDTGFTIPENKHKKKLLESVLIDFGSYRANTFRQIPLPSGLELEEVVGVLSHQKLKLYISRLKFRMVENDYLEISTDHDQPYWMNEEEFSIELKHEEGALWIKCNKCKTKSAFLCPHQQAVMHHARGFQHAQDLLEIGVPYEMHVEKIAEDFGIPQENVPDFFEFYLDNNNVFIIAKDENLVFDPEEALILNKEENVQLDALTFTALEEKYDYGNALVWTDGEDILLIKGKWNKVHSRLISSFTPEDIPTYLSKQEILLWNQLAVANEELDVMETFAILKNHREVLHSMMHFYQLEPDHISKNSLSSFRFRIEMAELHTSVREDGAFVRADFHLELGGNRVKISELDYYNSFIVIHQAEGWLLNRTKVGSLLYELNGRDYLVFLKNNYISIESKMLTYFGELGNLDMKGIKKINLTKGTKQIHIREVNSFLIFEPTIIYNDLYKFSIYGNNSEYNAEDKTFYYASEDEINAFKNIIRQLYPNWDKEYVPQGYVYLHIKEAMQNFWILDVFEKLNKADVTIYGQENLKSVHYNFNKINVSSHITSGIDWFEAEVEIQYGDLPVAKKEWVEAIRNNRKYIKLSDGTLGVLPELWINKLSKLLAVAEPDKNQWKINKSRFNIVEDLFGEIDDEALRKEINEKQNALAEYDKNKKYTLPKKLKAKLRDYQLHGYRWLRFLEEFGFGGCLADDMGLGKTVQVLALLLQQKQAKKGPSLIIVPRSLLFNWAQEIEKFTPDLQFLIHHGSNRQLGEKEYKSFDLVITTYDTVVRDVKELKNFTWNYVILDESQAIKNPSSKRYKAMRLLQSRNKLAMTGTPIENNTFDLYAQFSFLNPGIFGSQKRFKDDFSTPIDVLRDPDRTEMLRRLIHPFLLRRTKEQVASDLPEKTESIIYCDMGDEQRKQYEQLKNYIKLGLENSIEEDAGNAKFMILDGLLKLRQLCNSPELLDSTLPPKKKESEKIETLINLVTEDLGNHKALIFSQFVSMLTLIRDRLDDLGIKYSYLDGSTRDRQASVKAFMEQDDCQLFLISIKAGNTGLNLTMADYVYIIDPWWNPAVEAQAIDRTHRIGQDKKVFAYRMICKDTIEEKIVELQKKKKSLASELIQVEENVFKALSKEELMTLFE